MLEVLAATRRPLPVPLQVHTSAAAGGGMGRLQRPRRLMNFRLAPVLPISRGGHKREGRVALGVGEVEMSIPLLGHMHPNTMEADRF